MSIPKQAWIYLAVIVVVGIVCYVALPRGGNPDEAESSDFDDLQACSMLTSFDSTKSLYLAPSHQARFSDRSGLSVRWDTGTWELIDEDAHRYRIKVDGRTEDYTLVSAPAGEGCMLAAGSPDAANLQNSWYSALTDPKD